VPALPKEARELVDQFGRLTNQIHSAMDDRAIAPVHRRSDAPTEALSLSSRVKPVPHSVSASRFHGQRAKANGQRLVTAFRKAIPYEDMEFDEELFGLCYALSEEVWLRNRTRADLERVATNNPPDWDPRFIKLFLKGQTIKKLASICGPAKKGQIVTTFPLCSIFYEAPWAMYFELKLAAVLPEHIYLHARKSSADMQAWYLRFGVADSYTTNDVTGWDTGCDEGTMHFDVRIMQSFGMPVFFTDAYCSRKLNCRTFLGDFPVMQASGDRWTWTLNTYGTLRLCTSSLVSLPVPLCASPAMISWLSVTCTFALHSVRVIGSSSSRLSVAGMVTSAASFLAVLNSLSLPCSCTLVLVSSLLVVPIWIP